MEVAPISTTTPKSPDPDIETQTRIQLTTIATKPKSFTNGVLRRHHHYPPPIVVSYKECLKNHAATLGGLALDGCGEFMPSPAGTPTDPSSLKCAACGCHRNFHRRETEDPTSITAATATIEYLPHHRHHPPPPTTQQPPDRSPNSASPPPISSSYYPSAPHMLLSLSGGLPGALYNHHHSNPTLDTNPINMGSNSKKRFRTKFTQFQKDRMLEFAEKIGWKIQKRDDETVQEFCNEVGVDRVVLKVWMHNNKNNFGKKDPAINGGEFENKNNIDNSGQNLNHHFETVHLGTNVSSS